MSEFTLYDISEEFVILDELLLEKGGEEDEDYIRKLNIVSSFLEDKIDGCVGYIRREEDLILAAKTKINELKELIEVKNNRIESFKGYIKVCLNKSGKKLFSGMLNEIKLRKPSKKVLITNEAMIPPEYVNAKTTYSIDKKGIKDYLKNNGDSPFAELIDGEQSLTIGLKKGSSK